MSHASNLGAESTAQLGSISGGVSTDHLSYLLECSVCLESLGLDHKVLPCQHTFCLSCLEDLATKRKGVAEGEAAILFLCPECRYEVTTPISALPTNVILNRILSGLNSNQNLPNASAGQGGSGPKTPTAAQVTKATPSTKAVPPPPLAIGEHRKLPIPKVSSSSQDNNNIPGNWSTNPFLTGNGSGDPPESPLPVLPPKLAPVTAPPLPARPQQSANQQRASTQSAPSQMYRALYDYKPVKPDELALKKDELYFVIEKCQDGWFKGSSLNSLKTGVFPGNYVLHVQEEINRRKEPRKSCDLIDFTSDIMDVFGANNSKQSQQLNKKDAKSREATPSSASTKQAKPILYRAIMPFPSSSQYELELKQGDVIVMNRIREDGWCKGTLNRSGQTGLFPLSFVEKIS